MARDAFPLAVALAFGLGTCAVPTDLDAVRTRFDAAPTTGQDAAASRHAVVVSQAGPRYLRWVREWHHCAGVMHQRASFACMLTEAKVLNRTAVVQNDYCMHKYHTLTASSQSLDSIDRMYNLDEIRLVVGVLLRNGSTHVSKILRSDSTRRGATLPQPMVSKEVSPHVKTSSLLGDQSTLITRRFENNYWYDLCGKGPLGNPELDKTPAHIAVYEKVNTAPHHIATICQRIVKEIEGPFSVVHVRRGDKARDKTRWPNLDSDTRGNAILASPAFNDKVPTNNSVYIATDERNQGVFSALFHSRRAFTMANFTQTIPEIRSLSAYVSFSCFHFQTATWL